MKFLKYGTKIKFYNQKIIQNSGDNLFDFYSGFLSANFGA